MLSQASRGAGGARGVFFPPLDAPLEVPRVKASAFLELGVATDKTQCGANSAVGITAQVGSSANAPSGGSVKVEIYAPDIQSVASRAQAVHPHAGASPRLPQSLAATPLACVSVTIHHNDC